MTVFELVCTILLAAIPAATSLLYVALGELIYERSGVLNLGLEGTMLVGAVTAVYGQTVSSSPVFAVLLAAAAAAGAGVLHAILCVWLRTNQVVTGLAFVVLLTGATAFWGQSLVGQRVDVDLRISQTFPGGFSAIAGTPFDQDLLTYLAVVLTIVSWWWLFRSVSGAKLRAAGDSADVARALGINIRITRVVAGAIGGALAGAGGAHLSLVYASQWQENMTAGRGWIALVLVIFARWHPGALLPSAYVFGALGILQLNLQAFGVESSSYLISMVPFALAIAVLSATSAVIRNRPSSMPADLGVPISWHVTAAPRVRHPVMTLET
ncbi:MAG TPA: ABC transporter permease [Thermoanaerobaculia bacterium]